MTADTTQQGLTRLSALEAAALIRAGNLTSTELVTACLDRIAEREPTVRAWAHLDREHALEQARARDAALEDAAADGGDLGPLHGVPVGVKDLIDTADQPTEYGSPIYAELRPAADADCVERLRSAGAVIIGKTVTTEFALYHPGPTTNPHDHGRTPGGSSSGSAAAVADHMVPLAIGTQTAGSIVRPASFCGTWGMKPTYGAVPMAGVKPASPALDTLGLFARTPADLAACLRVMGGDALAELGTKQTGADGATPRRVAFAKTAEWDMATPATQTAIVELARRAGLEEVVLPAAFNGLVDAQTTIMDAEVAAALAPEYTRHRSQLSTLLQAGLERGLAVTTADLSAARDVATRGREALHQVFAEVDALLVPSVIGEAPEGLEGTGNPVFCRAWTLLGTPAVAVPGLLGPAGLPLGVQVVAAPGRDRAALASAAWLATVLAQMDAR